MAEFVKKTWACGDDITANELNRMEDGIEEALDKGYSCTEEWVTLTDESVTTTKAEESDPSASADLVYAELITADTIQVTFNGTEYVCENFSIYEGEGAYGAPWNTETQSYDWSEYPFRMNSFSDNSVVINVFGTETAGTYPVKIEVGSSSVTTTPCFQKAVRSVVGSSSSKFVVTFTQDGSTYTADHTYEEVLEAYNSGKVVEGKYGVNAEGETITYVCTLARIENSNATFTGVSDVYSLSAPRIDAFAFKLYDSNLVEHTDVVIVSSN